MHDFGMWTQLLAAVSIALIVVSCAILLLQPQHPPTQLPRGQLAFLFDGARLVNATRPAKDLLKLSTGTATDRDRLVDLLSHRFPELAQHLAQINELGAFKLLADDGSDAIVTAELTPGGTRITLDDSTDGPAIQVAETIQRKTIQDELELLRQITNSSAQLMWRTGANGQITWANQTFLDLAKTQAGDDAIWPPAPLFDAEPQHPYVTERHALLLDTSDKLTWYDLCWQPAGGGRFYSAQDVTSAVDADDLRRDLMQTLTKTFGGLSTGLAVFDRNRELVMFNPRLGDLTKIKAPELLSRPTIDSFLDLLREKRFLPEPRDYTQWRKKMTDIEANAQRGNYVEIWQLPDQRNIRITGHPFPGGALALFFEDITEILAAEHAMAKSQRQSQDILDTVDQAIAVFAPDDGAMTVCNTSYRKMWPRAAGQPTPNLASSIAQWRRAQSDAHEWDDILSTHHSSHALYTSFTSVTAPDRHAKVTARRLPDGHICVTFDEIETPTELHRASA